MTEYKNEHRWLPISRWSVVGGVLYCSWPLGNYLNPVANRGLASNLEAAGQPYNWLFVGLDIITGILVVSVTAWLLHWVKSLKLPWLRLAIWGYGAFGLLTVLDALLPLDCVSTEASCRPIIHDPMVIVHGIASIGSIAGLTMSIIAIWWLLARSHHSGTTVKGFLHMTVATWFGFGLATATLIALSRSSVLSQHLFIIICGAWTAVLPYFVWRVLNTQGSVLNIKEPHTQ